MQTPEEFKRFVMLFYSTTRGELANPEKWIAGHVALLTANEKRVVKQYLSELVDPKNSNKDLLAAWESGNPLYYISEDGIRYFMTMIVSAINN